jgi:predicted adenylyl cyclase CyaB
MATNIEIKARVARADLLRKLVEDVSNTPVEVINQEDVFFRVPQGRLKLRILQPDLAELIYYEREDTLAPKRSDYYISRSQEPIKLRKLLGEALGERGVVRKRRLLYWVENTRVHLDEVENLGSFMELEVVLVEGQSMEEGLQIARGLMQRLGIQPADLIETAYIDLLELRTKVDNLADHID